MATLSYCASARNCGIIRADDTGSLKRPFRTATVLGSSLVNNVPESIVVVKLSSNAAGHEAFLCKWAQPSFEKPVGGR